METISRIDVWAVALPMEEFTISGGTQSVRSHVLVRLESNQGAIGWGEASPNPLWGDDTQEGVVQAILKYLGPAVVGSDPLNMELLHSRMDQRLAGNVFAKTAVDMACHDLAGRILRLPVYRVLGGPYRTEWRIRGAIGIKPPLAAAKEALKIVEEGHDTVKMKAGANYRDDWKRLSEVRKAVGPDIRIWLDMNQGYPTSFAIQRIRRLEEFDLEIVEQPVPRWDLEGMRRVTDAVDVPIMADESVYTPREAWMVTAARAADIINIKVAKSGGLYRARQIAAIAEAAGVPCSHGGMGECGIGHAANRHFIAATCAVNITPGGCGGPAGEEVDLLEEPLSWDKGVVKVPDGPGLGVSVDMSVLERYGRLVDSVTAGQQ